MKIIYFCPLEKLSCHGKDLLASMGQIFVHSKGYSIFYKVRHPFSPIPARIQCASFKKVTLTEQIRYKEKLAKERWKKSFLWCDYVFDDDDDAIEKCKIRVNQERTNSCNNTTKMISNVIKALRNWSSFGKKQNQNVFLYVLQSVS